MQSPKWLSKAVFYEIYPQSFLDTDGDGIGDLKGIEEKLDYIKGMGFNSIWLNPIYESLFFDAGYDVSDYKKVAKRYGGNKAFSSLLKKAHKMGIRIVLDLVPGHTAINHKWFKESQKAKENKYTDRFIWNKNVWDCEPDCNWIRGFSERNGAAMINFFSIQPKLNYGFGEIKHPEYEETVEGKGPQGTINAMIDVIRYWLSLGVDGFRVDMAGWLVARDPKGTETIKVWKQVFSVIKKEFPESVFISEWADPERSLVSGFDCDFLLQDMHFETYGLMSRSKKPFFKEDGEDESAKKFFEIMEPLFKVAKENCHYLAMISGNHDTERLASWLNPKEAKLYYAFMLTMPYVPFFYYGDELGMRYLKGIASVEGGYQRTGSRSPMQWDKAKKNFGFSESDYPYIVTDKKAKGISVAEQAGVKGSVLETLRDLIAIKNGHPALDNDASFKLLEQKDGYLIYQREKGGEALKIYFNVRGDEKKFSVSKEAKIVGSIGQAKISARELKLGKQSFAIVK